MSCTARHPKSFTFSGCPSANFAPATPVGSTSGIRSRRRISLRHRRRHPLKVNHLCKPADTAYPAIPPRHRQRLPPILISVSAPDRVTITLQNCVFAPAPRSGIFTSASPALAEGTTKAEVTFAPLPVRCTPQPRTPRPIRGRNLLTQTIPTTNKPQTHRENHV